MNRFRNGFETQLETVSDVSLPVEGTIPNWLTGTYVRNGPGQFELEKARYWHWFDGLAMPHRYTFADGNVTFANRYLRTANYVEDTDSQTLNYRMPATDPKRTFWQKLISPFYIKFTDNTNIHTIQMAGEYVALTERIDSWTFDLQTLETLGRFKYDDNIGSVMATGHPHYDPQTRTIYNYMLKFGLKSTYELYRIQNRTHHLIAKIPVWNPSYMHSFGMTENYLVLTEFPMKLNPLTLMQFLFTDTSFFDNFTWNPQVGTRITVVDKNTGEIVKQMETEAFFCWHHINSFEQGDTVVVDLAAYADWTVVQGLYLDTMRADQEFSTMTAEYRRYTIPLGAMADRRTTADFVRMMPDSRMELPRINYNHYNTKPYRYAYGIGIHGQKRDFPNQVVKVDTNIGAITHDWFVDGHYPSEPVFAPRPGATDEDDGVLMVTVYNSDPTNEGSYLLLLDAHDLSQIATAPLPFRLPFNFHGRWYPNGDMYAL